VGCLLLAAFKSSADSSIHKEFDTEREQYQPASHSHSHTASPSSQRGSKWKHNAEVGFTKIIFSFVCWGLLRCGLLQKQSFIRLWVFEWVVVNLVGFLTHRSGQKQYNAAICYPCHRSVLLTEKQYNVTHNRRLHVFDSRG